MVELKISTTS